MKFDQMDDVMEFGDELSVEHSMNRILELRVLGFVCGVSEKRFTECVVAVFGGKLKFIGC